MKNGKAIILGSVIALIALAALYGYREYYRKPALLDTLKPDSNLTADQLLNAYQADETRANSLYLGKVVEVSGTIASMSNEHDTLINILLGKKAAMERVSCSMSKQSQAAVIALKAGQEVTIRGVCTGYLMDVELNRCVLIK